MDLGAQAAAGPADGLVSSRLPGTGGVLMSAGTTVLSRIRYAKSRSSETSAKDAFPHALFVPTAEPAEVAVSMAEAVRQIPPRRTGAGDPEDGFDKQAVITARSAPAAVVPDNVRRNPIPLPVAQYQAIC
jgi:hypothetical protein